MNNISLRRVPHAVELVGWIVFAVVTLVSNSQATAAERPNVLLIVADDLRPDTIRALGNERIETPNLDKLARAGTVFRRATCANPVCVPSRAELLSGLNSFHNGFFAEGRLRQGVLLWPQVMQHSSIMPPNNKKGNPQLEWRHEEFHSHCA